MGITAIKQAVNLNPIPETARHEESAIVEAAMESDTNNRSVLSTSIEVLHSTSSRYGVLWSPQTFIRDVALEYNELPFCIEGSDPKTEDDIEEFIGMISQHIYHTNLQQRLCQQLHQRALRYSPENMP